MNRSELEKLSKSELIILFSKIEGNKFKIDHGIKKGDIILEKEKLPGGRMPKIYEVEDFMSGEVYLRCVRYDIKKFIKFTNCYNTDDMHSFWVLENEVICMNMKFLMKTNSTKGSIN